MSVSLLFALLLAADASCPAIDANLPAPLAGWRVAAPLTGALAPGGAARVDLHPTGEVAYAAPPERADAPGTYGGVFRLVVEREGSYRIALGRAGWIDVVSGGRRLSSVAHGHGPACSSIRKIVDFTLPAGEHVVQLSGIDQEMVTVMVAAK